MISFVAVLANGLATLIIKFILIIAFQLTEAKPELQIRHEKNNAIIKEEKVKEKSKLSLLNSHCDGASFPEPGEAQNQSQPSTSRKRRSVTVKIHLSKAHGNTYTKYTEAWEL